eukprot:14702471-Alexandrium_andersonii.AAC.1
MPSSCRFGTLHLAVHPSSLQPLPRPTVIFRGKGGVQAKEQPGYHPGVDAFFDEKAWATQSFMA